MSEPRPSVTWAFLTNHAHVLVCIANDPDSRTRDIAQNVGITERAAQRIIADLIEAGYLERTKVGRRNRYTINRLGPLRHPLVRTLQIGPLVDLLRTAGDGHVPFAAEAVSQLANNDGAGVRPVEAAKQERSRRREIATDPD